MNFKEKFGSLGIYDDASYAEFCQKCMNRKDGPTEEELSLFDPDTIDNGAFWSYIDKNFSHSVCGEGQYINNSFEIDEQNRKNIRYAMYSGVLNILMTSLLGGFKVKVLEIGAGWGCLKNFFDKQIDYNGIDINPKIEGIIKTDGYTIPEPLNNDKYNFIISSNVFQHLSLKQRRSYYREVSNLLDVNGRFCFTNFFKTDNTSKYVMHYGQYTPTQTQQEILDDTLENGLGPVSIAYGVEGNIAITCVKKNNVGVSII